MMNTIDRFFHRYFNIRHAFEYLPTRAFFSLSLYLVRHLFDFQFHVPRNQSRSLYTLNVLDLMKRG